ncbi:UDP-GlcNAc--UDP-phosphate GlcNAc-1-phosphate transferase [Flexithrix dorotheae]|uniref:UDP-GlcNAc--UDP-phosphate GlcNAc-1-phosphate transferase n=1 Tax=Flexithrix dorotheae TaxID=70993 RepID=UPI0003998431|nr:UDP-GlcNAc--UDP-phosphate GlcNAc-1-phosphate transferase [Flexithrix dorotheae]
MAYLIYFIVFVALVLLEVVYFRLADRFSIIDKPNERSSHKGIIIRGGGVIFYFAGLIFFMLSKGSYPWFILGLTLVALISMVDDMRPVPNRIRILFHLSGILLLMFQLDLMNLLPIWGLVLVLIFTTGIVNAFNFMDGINGISGGYGLVTIISLLIIQLNIFGWAEPVDFIQLDFLIYVFLGLVVFNYFNFRKKAKCFAGDVGSVSLAFLLIFALFSLMVTTENFTYILFFAVYGIDSIITIAQRLLRRENIFKAHRSHFYQYLANEMGIPHLQVAGMYMTVQFIINLLVIYYSAHAPIFLQYIMGIGMVLYLSVLYIFFKIRIMRKVLG